MHSLLRTRNTTRPGDLAYHLSRAANSLASIVERSIKTAGCVVDNEQKDLKATLTTATRATASILTGYNSLSRLPGHESVMGQSVYAIAEMFQTFVTSLSDLSVLEASKESDVHGTASAKVNSRSKAAATRPKSAKVTKAKGNAALDHVTGFMAGIIDLLDHKVEATKDLFESLIFCLLDELGTALYISTFGKHRAETIEAEIASLLAADDTTLEEAGERTPEQQHVDLLAPYLIHLLARAMSITPLYFETVGESRRPKNKPLGMRTSIKGVLAIQAKESLQRTLVRCMFGTSGGDNDNLLGECLKLTPPTFKPVPVPKVKSADVGQWFREEVWRLLGWEILSNAADS
jgi:hypothetical protein